MRVKVTQGPGGNARLAKLRQAEKEKIDSNLKFDNRNDEYIHATADDLTYL